MFLYKKLNLPDYDLILEELRLAVPWSWIKEQKGFIPFKSIQTPCLDHSLSGLGLKVKESWIIVLPGDFTSLLHIDYVDPAMVPVKGLRSAMNFPLYNCDQGCTEFYSPVDRNSGTRVKHRNSIDSEDIYFMQCELKQELFLDRYTLDSVYLLNTQMPHRVVNLSDQPRVCVSLRFQREPLNLWLNL